MSTPATDASASFLAGGLRVTWMLFGNIGIGVPILLIATETSGALSWRDVVAWISVAVVLAARYFDIRKYGGSTAYGQPATSIHFKRHAVILLILTAAAWGIAHAIARA